MDQTKQIVVESVIGAHYFQSTVPWACISKEPTHKLFRAAGNRPYNEFFEDEGAGGWRGDGGWDVERAGETWDRSMAAAGRGP